VADRLPWVWGATDDEQAASYAADAVVEGPAMRLDRAVDCLAPTSMAFRWLCQLALAPYSYDLVDNLGRRSPRELDPSTELIEPGRVMASVYVVDEVVAGESWSGRLSDRGTRWFGPLGVTYAALPHPTGDVRRSRLFCRMVVPARTRAQRARATALAWGDLVMIRRQLLTLAALAGRDAAREAGWHD